MSGRPGMRLAAEPEGIFAANFEGMAQHGHVGKGGAVALGGLGCDFGKADALDGGVRSREILRPRNSI